MENTKNELIKNVLDNIDFNKLYQVFELYKIIDHTTGYVYYPGLSVSVSYCGEIATRKMSPETLRDDAQHVLEMLFDLAPDEFEHCSCGHGNFTSQIEDFEDNEIKQISLTFRLFTE